MDPTRLNLNGYRGGSSRIIHIQWRVVRLIANLNCKVNLIALNPGPGIPFETPAPERVAAFQQIVRQSVPCFVRKPRGLDIFAACGQLKRVSA